MQWPQARDSHSSVLINESSSGPQLLVVGRKNNSDCYYDCWLFDINKKIWNQLMVCIILHRSHISYNSIKCMTLSYRYGYIITKFL